MKVRYKVEGSSSVDKWYVGPLWFDSAEDALAVARAKRVSCYRVAEDQILYSPYACEHGVANGRCDVCYGNGLLRRGRITPEWCINMAKMEDGHEVGAGVAGLGPTSDCPHAAPFRYCETCKVSPCPIGLGSQQ